MRSEGDPRRERRTRTPRSPEARRWSCMAEGSAPRDAPSHSSHTASATRSWARSSPSRDGASPPLDGESPPGAPPPWGASRWPSLAAAVRRTEAAAVAAECACPGGDSGDGLGLRGGGSVGSRHGSGVLCPSRGRPTRRPSAIRPPHRVITRKSRMQSASAGVSDPAMWPSSPRRAPRSSSRGSSPPLPPPPPLPPLTRPPPPPPPPPPPLIAGSSESVSSAETRPRASSRVRRRRAASWASASRHRPRVRLSVCGGQAEEVEHQLKGVRAEHHRLPLGVARRPPPPA